MFFSIFSLLECDRTPGVAAGVTVLVTLVFLGSGVEGVFEYAFDRVVIIVIFILLFSKKMNESYGWKTIFNADKKGNESYEDER